MTTIPEDTISAIATGVGGAVAIVRLSGERALEIANRLWDAPTPLNTSHARRLILGRVSNAAGAIDDACLAVFMPGPHSYTGEDVVEFHCHGGQLVARTVLASVLEYGARHAEPGEFTKRAFLNGRIELTQAEAVLDLIQAQSTMALHTANRQLDGVLGRQIETAWHSVRELLAEVEVRMDFVDEDLDWDSAEQISNAVNGTIADLQRLADRRDDGVILRDGIRMVIAGAPNAGKSSLLNAILGHDRAIVTDIPGTTRDTLEELAHIRGIPVRVIDTAGIRTANDIVEQAGIERSLASAQHAHVVLWVVDLCDAAASAEPDTDHFAVDRTLVVGNKSDIAPTPLQDIAIRLSAITGEGLETLFDAIERMVWNHPHHDEPEVAVNTRHAALLDDALEHLCHTTALLADEQYELVAVEMRAALDRLGRITGRTLQPDILDNIFSRFCIGK